MNLAQRIGSLPRFDNASLLRTSLRLALGLCLTAALSASAFAQYGGGGGMGTGTPGTPGYVAPSNGYGSGKAIGIGVGAAAGAGVLFLALHHRGGVSASVQPADDCLRLADEKNKKSYVLATNALLLKPLQHVELKSHKSQNESR